MQDATDLNSGSQMILMVGVDPKGDAQKSPRYDLGQKSGPQTCPSFGVDLIPGPHIDPKFGLGHKSGPQMVPMFRVDPVSVPQIGPTLGVDHLISGSQTGSSFVVDLICGSFVCPRLGLGLTSGSLKNPSCCDAEPSTDSSHGVDQLSEALARHGAVVQQSGPRFRVSPCASPDGVD